MAHLYANENFPHPAVEILRQLGHTVLTTNDVGRSGPALPDEDVLAFATSQNLVVLTLNRRDFIRLHGRTPTHAGIVVCTLDSDFTALAKRVNGAVSAVGALNGQLIRVNRGQPT